MKRTISLWLGLLALAVVPGLSQAPAAAPATGKIHGHVINPTGAPQTSGTVTLQATTRPASGPGLSAQTADKGVITVGPNGEFSGDVAPGTYTLIFRQTDTPPDKQVDHIDNVKITPGQTTEQDIDMSRKEYLDQLPPDQKQKLEELRKHNSEALKANEVIKALNADLKVVTQDIKDADAAHATAVQQLGASAAKPDVDAKEKEIKTAKYTEIESLMQKDTAGRPNESVLWAYLGQAEVGLKKYDDATTAYKKALDLESAAKTPKPAIQGLANSGLGEVYARSGKVPEANAAYDAAAKVDPTKAGFYLRNEAVIFFQMNNGDAQVAAANDALKADPNQPVLYYIIGQGLVQKATVDAKTQRIILPPGCADAYQKYLELAPDGPYAADAKGILAQAGQKASSSYKSGKKS
jgi:tetratricopeptide (TPR) repeat protein